MMTSLDIEIAVAKYFSPRVNLIVPNISWGLLFYEVDLLVITPSNYCYEVEIKISKSDLKADLKKKHNHNSNKMRRLYFAIPDYLESSLEYIPERAGILMVETDSYCKCIREPQNNLEAEKLTDEERYNVARLGTMRIWTLKNKLLELSQRTLKI